LDYAQGVRIGLGLYAQARDARHRLLGLRALGAADPHRKPVGDHSSDFEV
jgi:Predicted phosphohydrolases